MSEKLQSATLRTIDQYLRREDTVIAQFLKAISPEAGAVYRDSKTRRLMEIILTAPTSLVALPVIAYLGAEIKKADGGSVFFEHKRNDGDGKFSLWKLRVMIEGAEQLTDTVKPETMLPEDDPRNTPIGAELRKYELEELPQLIQVLLGRLRLVGLRASSSRSLAVMAEKRPVTASEWQNTYFQDKGSLFSLNAAINDVLQRKNPQTRYHPDRLYAEKMSLGLDGYVIVRNLMNLLDRYLSSKQVS